MRTFSFGDYDIDEDAIDAILGQTIRQAIAKARQARQLGLDTTTMDNAIADAVAVLRKGATP